MKSHLQQVTYPLARIPKLVSGPFTIRLEEFGPIGAGAILLLLSLTPSDLGALAPVRLLLGALYVLFVPGYCLSTALFPRRDDLAGTERLGLSLGLSIAAVPLLALLLDRIPGGLQMWPIVVGELSIVAAGALITMVRRARLPQQGEQGTPPGVKTASVETDTPDQGQRLLPGRRAYGVLATLLLLTLLSVGWFLLDPTANGGMSEFYILGQEGLAELYPRTVTVDEPVTMMLGIANREGSVRTYSVEIRAQNPWDAGQAELVARAGPFDLAPGTEVQEPLTWSMPWAGSDQQVEFLLFASEQPSADPYRQLRLFVDVVE